jgi:hypothetical protein
LQLGDFSILTRKRTRRRRDNNSLLIDISMVFVFSFTRAQRRPARVQASPWTTIADKKKGAESRGVMVWARAASLGIWRICTCDIEPGRRAVFDSEPKGTAAPPQKPFVLIDIYR